MLSKTSEYALRAVIYLAQFEDDCPIPGRVIASETGVPAKYLSKILGDLVRAEVLVSSPGKTGGFQFMTSSAETRLLKVLAPFEQFELRRCPFGNKACSDIDPCLAHNQWKNVVEAELRFMSDTTVLDIAVKANNA